ncbi:MAG: ParB N-terminal domain-containing protein [Candidatus Omnitrophica bacterium]|nr:ParB N-terminal domain-containing protein [Candidatus Omnitrophota bacterium]
MTKKFRVNKNFSPCTSGDEDEVYRNGIFEFNITKMIEYIRKNSANIRPEVVAVEDFCKEFSSIDEAYMDKVDVSQPVIIAEIAPGRYNLIDGNHRMEKARRMGLVSLMAYKMDVEQHMQFLTDKRGYVAYIEYWNSKLR